MKSADQDIGLPALDRDEQLRIMREWSAELWDDAVEQGFTPSLIARILIEDSLRELGRNGGTAEIEKMLSDMQELNKHGALDASATLQ